jgi:hypothetical protein
VSCKYRLMYQLSYIIFSRTNQDTSLVLFDGPSRVRSQITSVLCPKNLVLCPKHLLVPYASNPGRYKSEPGLCSAFRPS